MIARASYCYYCQRRAQFAELFARLFVKFALSRATIFCKLDKMNNRNPEKLRSGRGSRILLPVAVAFAIVSAVLLFATIFFAWKYFASQSSSQDGGSGNATTTHEMLTSPGPSTTSTTGMMSTTSTVLTTHFSTSPMTTAVTAEETTASPTNGTDSQHCFDINLTKGFLEASQNIRGSINFDVDPCEDFYEYACGVWPLKHPRPPDHASYTIYNQVRQRVSEQLRDSIEALDDEAPEHLVKLRRVYDSCANTTNADMMGGLSALSLLQNSSNSIGGWPMIDPHWQERANYSMEEVIGSIKHNYGIDTTLFTFANAYELNSSETVLLLTGSFLPLGLGIFTAKYYLNDTRYGYIMEAYENLTLTTARLLVRDAGSEGHSQVNESDAVDMLRFERRLARLVENSFAEFNVALWNVSTLKEHVPGFDWDVFFARLLPGDIFDTLYSEAYLLEVNTPVFVGKMVELLRNTTQRTIQNYAVWRLLKYSLPYLGADYRNALAAFDAVFHGNKQPPPRWEECVAYVKGRNDLPALGYAAGEVFIRAHFNDSRAPTDVLGMVYHIKSAFETMVNELDWMDEHTKRGAIEKANALRANIAYPHWLLNTTYQEIYHSDLHLDANLSMFDINLAVRSWAVRQNFRLLLKPYDKTSFGGSPATTDAWYSATKNSLSVPAGELQPPFYKLDYPRAVSFGAAGAVIGHEMTHGFDTQGSFYDAQGNLSPWWTPATRLEYLNRTRCLIDQFNRFRYPGGLHVNGARTLAENIADLSGLKAAFRGYQRWMAANGGGEEARLPGMAETTSEQTFFLSFASFWCGSQSRRALENQLLIGTHTPDKFRVIGPLQNMPQFAQAFSCHVGSFMNPVHKCAVW